MKKYFKVLIVALIIIMLIVVVKVLKKGEITFNEISELINPQITENMCLKINTESINGNYSEEYYIKDNLAYENFYIDDEKIQEFTFNFETKEQANVFHNSKEIFLYKIEDQSLNIISNKLNYYKDLIVKSLENSYKFYGKEIINNDEVIKISVDFKEDFFLNVEHPRRLYFYINEENKSIEKIEHYDIINDKEELVITDNFIYSYNTVTDKNILKFDINNYPDYTLNKEEI